MTQHRAEAVDLHGVEIRLGRGLVVVEDFLADRSLALQEQPIAHEPQLAVGGERAVQIEPLIVAFGDVLGADRPVEAASKARREAPITETRRDLGDERRLLVVGVQIDVVRELLADGHRRTKARFAAGPPVRPGARARPGAPRRQSNWRRAVHKSPAAAKPDAAHRAPLHADASDRRNAADLGAPGARRNTFALHRKDASRLLRGPSLSRRHGQAYRARTGAGRLIKARLYRNDLRS